MPCDVCEYHCDGVTVSTDPRLLDLDAIHEFLTHSYWSPGVPKEIVEKAIENSLCFGLHGREGQIGFARVVTDYARYAYLCDLFILKPYRGRGYGKWLVKCVVECSLLKGVRVIALATKDAQGLYSQFGFEELEDPQGQMNLRFDMPWHCPGLIEE